ncbi:MAG: AAA family ATPase [Anaerolineales bacterium]|nr:AAA family ATPase [Anaerolineales bacterium]
MVTPDHQEITRLQEALVALESQREILGDTVVEPLIQASRKQLAELQSRLETPQQQRKLATILFADVVASTRLGQHLEADEVLEMMDRILNRLSQPVEKFGGRITRYQGDGFKAVFGVPVAQENDPEQAVRAGLGILETATQLARELQVQHGIESFQVRVGVNTGLVAIGGETEAQDTVMGQAVNLAARLESAAPPGGLLISHFTYQHVRGIFDLELLPPIQAKGFEEPVPVYLVKRPKPRSLRATNRGVEGVVTRMVGRQSELIYLQDALMNAIEEGEGQVVTVSGEAGIGKSRLLIEFQNWIEFLPADVQLYHGQAKLESQHVPYALLRNLFAYRFQIQDSDPPGVVCAKFEQEVAKAMAAPPVSFGRQTLSLESSASELQNGMDKGKDHAHFIGHLLGFGIYDSPFLQGLLEDPQALRNRGLISLREYFKAASRQAPVVLFLEDIHWADDSSLDAIKDLGRLAAEHPLVLVCLTRPNLYESRPFWGEGQEYYQKLELKPLSKRESRQLVEEILQYVDEVPPDLRDLILQAAEGNPFYIEEMIKMLIEQDVIVRHALGSEDGERWQVMEDTLTQIQVPATLTGVLQARLDSLQADERRIIQQASVVGRVFWDQAVHFLHANSNGASSFDSFNELFESLRAKEMVFRREDSVIAGAQEYAFKNDVLREVTYNSVLVRERKTYHGLVADWLLSNSQPRAGEFLGLVAEHLELAGRVEEAAGILTQTADLALSNYSNREARDYYLRALNLKPTETLKAQILTGLGRVFSRQGSYQKAIEQWEQAIQVCRKQHDVPGLARIYTLAMRASNPHYPQQAMQFAHQALSLTHRLVESPAKAHLLHQVGRSYFFSGLPDKAAEYCQLALEMGERLGDVAVQPDTFTTVGLLPNKSGEQAIQVLTKAEQLAESQQLFYILGRVRNNLATIALTNTGDYQASLLYSLKSAETQRLRGDVEFELNAFNLAAVIKLYLGDLDGGEALLEYIKSRLDEDRGLDVVYTTWLRWRALYLAMKGKWEEALEPAWEAYERIERMKNYQHMFDFLVSSLLQVLLEVDRFYQVQNWEPVESVVKQVIDRPGEINNSAACSWMSAVYSSQNRLEEAGQWLLKARQQLGDESPILNRWVYARAEIALAKAKQDWETAEQVLDRFIHFMDKLGHRWEVARAWLDWGDVCVSRGAAGDLEQARELYKKSLALFTEMGAQGYVGVVGVRLNNPQVF